MERRGPDKSMHCKFCKPPGTMAQEKPSSAQLETKTKLHLCHEVADLKVFDVFDEPGVVAEESEACICQLEGYEHCPKCAPDKKWKPKKKKVCDCPLGSRPHPNMAGLDTSNQKKKKKKEDDDEFWWEKYDREHDAMVKETWAAYLAQRKEDKRLAKCREREGVSMSGLMKPKWYQKLSCQQTIYLEYLATAIRLDLDENISDRTFFILSGIGFYPRPTKKMLEKCLRYCHYNSIRFLNQLGILLQEEDPFHERTPLSPELGQDLYAWNDRILMACICHLEFPKLLREIMERLPPLPQEKLPDPLPKPKFPKLPVKEYSSPYEQPLWRERMNWVEKKKLERLNRARQHMDKKRVKIPSLALVQRPSLIDARPTFLSQIEASLSFHRMKKSQKKRSRFFRKKEKAVFDSKVDVTAIAGIEASEVSTIPKADSEEICVFFREPKSESLHVEEEEEEEEEQVEENEEPVEVPEVRQEVPVVETRIRAVEKLSARSTSLTEDEEMVVEEGVVDSEDDIPFVTPPKTQSGATIEEPCVPPRGSPGPPASHYDLAKRQLGLINQELCAFDPNSDKSNDDEEENGGRNEIAIDIGDQLKKVVQKLRDLNLAEDDDEEEEEEEVVAKDEKVRKKSKKRRKCSKNSSKKGGKKGTNKSKKKTTKKKEEKKVEDPGADVSRLAAKYNRAGENEYQTAVASEEYEDYGEMDLIPRVESTDVCVCEVDKQKAKQEKRKKGGKNKKRKRSRKRKKTKTQSQKAKVKPFDPCRVVDEDTTEATLELSLGDTNEGKGSDGRSKGSGSDVKAEEEAETAEMSTAVRSEAEEDKTFYGNVWPLLKNILKDLSDEGFISAGYEEIYEHPDIRQLIKHLQGEIVRAKTKKRLYALTRAYWRVMEKRGKPKASPPDLNISQKKFDNATWDDKIWVSNLAKKKKDEFFFNVAKLRSMEAKDFYLTLFQEYFGTERFLKSYYAYMIPTRQECIMRGLT